MKSKKKYIIAAVITVIVSLLITVPPIMQEKIQDKNDEEAEKQIATQILDALQHNGFPDSELKPRSNNVYIDKYGKEYIDVIKLSNSYDIHIYGLQRGSDIASILNAVMPVFDEKFESGDGEIIANRLIESRWHDKYEDEVHAGYTSFHHIKYDEFLDDTDSYAKWILISL